MILSSRFLVVAVLLGLVAICSPIQASTDVFLVSLDGAQEVPSVTTPGFGTATAFIDPFSRRFSIYDTSSWDDGVFSDLIGTVTAAHVHGPAAAGTNGPVIVPLDIDLGVTSGGFTTPFQPTQPNNPYAFTLTPQQYQDALDGLFYINIHTTAFPGGEIRGQLIFHKTVPEPMTASLLAVGAIGLLTRRRTMLSR